MGQGCRVAKLQSCKVTRLGDYMRDENEAGQSERSVTRYGEWLEQVPEHIKKDRLWELEVYRKGLFFFDLVWWDCGMLTRYELGKPIAQQLIRSAGSICANMGEGFGRGFGKDYARFLTYALGSARESRGWYYRGRNLLKPDVLDHRLELLATIIAGLVTLSQQQKKL